MTLNVFLNNKEISHCGTSLMILKANSKSAINTYKVKLLLSSFQRSGGVLTAVKPQVRWI